MVDVFFYFNCGRKFQRFVDDSEVMDVSAKGCLYTWRNGHVPEDFIA